MLHNLPKTTYELNEVGIKMRGKSSPNHWRVEEEISLRNGDNIKIIITSKFKESMWCNKELVDKRKLRYYKYVIYINL